MSKLVRLLGKPGADGTSTEIRNQFKDAIKLTRDSKISFLGAQVDVVDDLYDEQFTITTDNNTFTIGSTKNAAVTVTLDTGIYTWHELINEIQKQVIYQSGFTSSTTSIVIGFGDNFEVAKDRDGRFEMKKTECVINTSKFESQWVATVGSPVVTDGGSYTGSTGSDSLTCRFPVPNASFFANFRGLRVNNELLRVSVVNTAGSVFCGIGVTVGGTYEYNVLNGGWVDSGVAAAAGDSFRLRRSQDTLTVSKSTAGVQTVLVTATITAQDATDFQESYYNITTPGTSVNGFTDSTSAIFDPPQSNNVLELTRNTDMTVTWGSTILARYLGFNKVGGFTVTGNPAILTSNHEMEGDLQAHGILVVLEDYILDSWDGSDLAKGRSSILYVLNNANVKNNRITFTAPEALPLAMRVINESIFELRVSFRNATSGAKLTLSGSPMVYLSIVD